MFERIANGWELSKQSLQVLRLDKELLIFPLLSGIACLLILAGFALPLWFTDSLQLEPGRDFALEVGDKHVTESVAAYLVVFLYYFLNYFVIVFFNSALISCAIIRFHGGNPTVGDGLNAATARLPQIFGWALVSATIGTILRAIESNSEKAGQFVAGLMGMAWSVVTYFVVPILVVEKLGPVAAAQRSFGVLKEAWGEALTANFGIGLLTFLGTLVASVPLVLGVIGVIAGNVLLGSTGIVVGIVLLLIMSLVSSALNTVVIAALYLYAAEGRVPQQFDERLLAGAFTHK